MGKCKSTNGLMKYLRENHGINIQGSTHKKKLQQVGYYHGYKGYRFFRFDHDRITYENFDELLYVIDLDTSLKTLFYPILMIFETSLKNIVLQNVLDYIKSDNFNVIYANALTDYKTLSKNTQKEKDRYKKAFIRRQKLRERIYNTISSKYEHRIIKHFNLNDTSVPIWAIFEIITLGEFAEFVSCLNIDIRDNISVQLDLPRCYDTNRKNLERILYLIKDLRNAVAHNDIIFDARFKTNNVDRNVIRSIELQTQMEGMIHFEGITDYFVLVMYMLRKIGITKSEIKKYVKQFEEIREKFRGKIPINVFQKIFTSDTRNKIQKLKDYL